jgi:hypothetical protein
MKSWLREVESGRAPEPPGLSAAFGAAGPGGVRRTRSFRIRVGKHTRRLRLKVDGRDALGNQSAFAKTFRLR